MIEGVEDIMEENKYLNEEKYQQNAKKLKTIGKIVLILGVCMFIAGAVLLFLGFTGFGKAGAANNPDVVADGIIGGFGLFALGGFMDAIGVFIIGVGGMLLMVAHRREIEAFSAQQIMPVAKEGINEMAPTIGNAAGEIAKGIKKGLNEDTEKKEE